MEIGKGADDDTTTNFISEISNVLRRKPMKLNENLHLAGTCPYIEEADGPPTDTTGSYNIRADGNL
jgi:hypothetical protein